MNRSHFQLVQSFNNHGASLLAAGDSRGAIVKFSDALKTSRQVMMGQTAKNTIITNTNNEQVFSALSLDECMIQSYRLVQSQMNDDDVASVTMIMNQQATLIQEDIDPSLMKDVDNETIAVIAIFNLALAHQKHAYGSVGEASPHQSGEMVLKKAIKLYDLALLLYQEGSAVMRDDSLLFLMALMHNIALAKQSLNDIAASEHCFQQLLAIIMVRLDTDGHVAGSRHSLIFNAFLRSVTNVLSPANTIAPAA